MAAFKPYEVIMQIEYGGAVPDGDTMQVCMKANPVQELVRCKDCRYRYFEGGRNERAYCTEHPNFGNLPNDWFCPDGLRREVQE